MYLYILALTWMQSTVAALRTSSVVLVVLANSRRNSRLRNTAPGRERHESGLLTLGLARGQPCRVRLASMPFGLLP